MIFNFQWDERESTKTNNEKSNGNFKVPYAKNEDKQEFESSPVKKLKTSKYKLISNLDRMKG